MNSFSFNDSAISEMLIALRQKANETSPEKFRKVALNLVHGLIPFDFSIWGKYNSVSNEWATREVYFHGQSEAASINAETIDQLYYRIPAELLTLPWISVNINCTQPLKFCDIKQQRAENKIYFPQYLCTRGYDQITKTPHMVVLGRNNNYHPFSENERILKQFLMPHLEASCDHNFQYYRQPAPTNLHELERRQSNALIDNHGVIFTSGAGFMELICKEFPFWHGPRLPEPVLDFVMRQLKSRYVGKLTTFTANYRNDVCQLGARPKQPIDDFSERTVTLATHFAEGLNHKEIGLIMNISPATVRNHISTIYKKLQINNKAQLAQTLSGLRQSREQNKYWDALVMRQ